MKWLCIALLSILSGVVSVSHAANADTIRIVAAENFSGDVARQVGGQRVSVSSILENPSQDPHLFEADASAARAIAHAQIVIVNAAGYDSWMQPLLAGRRSDRRHIIRVAALAGVRPGDNPHLWYNPETMPALATKLAALLTAVDLPHKDEYSRRLHVFLRSLKSLQKELALLRMRYAGTPVAATEPVFGYMAAALGLKMYETAFQTAMMNGVEPAPSQVIQFENDLRRRRVKVLIYNRQLMDQRVVRLRRIAQGAGIPAVGVTETQPRK